MKPVTMSLSSIFLARMLTCRSWSWRLLMVSSWWNYCKEWPDQARSHTRCSPCPPPCCHSHWPPPLSLVSIAVTVTLDLSSELCITLSLSLCTMTWPLVPVLLFLTADHQLLPDPRYRELLRGMFTPCTLLEAHSTFAPLVARWCTEPVWRCRIGFLSANLNCWHETSAIRHEQLIRVSDNSYKYHGSVTEN